MNRIVKSFIRGSVIGAGIFVAGLAHLCNSSIPRLPEIQNPSLLSVQVIEFINNLASIEYQEVSIQSAPSSVQELKPRYLSAENRILKILISSGGIGPSIGYIISESEPNYRSLELELIYPNIYKYTSIE